MNISPSTQVSEVVRAYPATTRVFERFSIDYCCGGKLPLAEACARAGLPCDEVMAGLHAVERVSGEVTLPDTLTALIEHIELRHHNFTRTELARAGRLMEKVLRAHGSHHPELAPLSGLLSRLSADLLPHLHKEERVLFPFLRSLEASLHDTPGVIPPFQALANPMRVMEVEHEEVGVLLRQMRELTSAYLPPLDACGSFRALYESLAALERDLHQHIHLENNVLFHRARELDARQSPARNDNAS